MRTAVPAARRSGAPAGAVEVVAERAPNGTVRFPTCSSAGVLAARPTPWGLYLVGTGAHPIGDDHLELDLSVGPSAVLEVRAVGATLARAGAAGGISQLRARARVGRDATLAMLGEPGIAAAGSHHRSRLDVALASGARLAVLEQVQLGRYGERPGRWTSATRVERGARVLFDSSFDAGPGAPGWASPAGLGGAVAVVALLVVDPAGLAPGEGAQWCGRAGSMAVVTFAAEGEVAQVCAFGDDLLCCRLLAGELAAAHGLASWAPLPAS